MGESRERIRSGNGIDQAMRLLAHFILAADGGWFTSEDLQVRAQGLGLPNEEVGINTGQFLLREGVGGDWAGQSGGGG